MADINTNTLQVINYNGTEVRTLKYGTTTVYVRVFLTLDEQGGSGVSDRYVYYGNGRTYGQYAPLPTPTRSGYTFGGWFTSTSGNGTQITNSTVVTTTSTTQTLYAYWIAQVVQTATPSIVSFGYIFNSWQINIRNNDSANATIRSEDNDSTPDIYRDVVSPNNTITVTSTQPSFATFTHYATALASGKTLSNVTSRTIT